MIELPPDLLSFLQSEEQRAFDEGLNEERRIALDFYHGKPFGDEVEGRSQLVTRDVAEVVDYMTVSIMRTMVSDKVVEFEATREDQKEDAKKATELVAWQFLRKQSGYQIVRDALMAGLLEKTGVIKAWAQPRTATVEEVVPITAIDADETIVAAEELPDQFDQDPVTGEIVPLARVLRQVEQQPDFKDAAVPNEEFGFSPEARTLDEAGYIVQRSPIAIRELMAEGVTEEEAKSLWGNSSTTQSLSDARDGARSRKDSENGAGWSLSRQVTVNEEYVFWDWNGDGIAERLQVRRVGTKVLSVTQVDEQPFVIWCPFPMAHRIVGLSLADKTMDIQRIRSVLLRQAMDALYFANAPRLLIDTGSMIPETIDDVLSIIPGAPIRFKGTPPQPFTMPFAAGAAMEMLEFQTGERESRTGITRHNQGLNPDTLNKTASGMAMLQQAGAQIEEYVARNFGEALAELFEKKLRLFRRFGLVASIKVGGQFAEVDASQIGDDMDMAVRVGLGTGRKDERIQKRLMLLEQQKEGLAANSPLVNEEKTFANLDALVADMGLGDGSSLFVDPRTTGPQQPKRDPAEIEAEGKVQVEQQRQQDAHAKAMYDAETARLKMLDDAQRQREKDALENERADLSRASEESRAERTLLFNQELAVRKLEMEMATRRANDAITVPSERPGGRLDA